jgi:hypothetical protein
MSVKEVKRYYSQICDQYQEMINDIKDLEKEAEQGLIEPERIERLKEQIAPIKQNYERWSYMMFLLNEPKRKSKKANYIRRSKKLIENLDPENSLESVLAENEEARTHIGE